MLLALPWLLALATIGARGRVPARPRHRAGATSTVAIVVTFFLASTSHAWVWRGLAWTSASASSRVGGGLAVEAVGMRTGVPVRRLRVRGPVRPQVFGVPWVVPLAWAMMAYPALVLAAPRHALAPSLVPVVGGSHSPAWDLFLDPQMVARGLLAVHRHRRVRCPTCPASRLNYLGWLLAAVVMMALLDRLPRPASVPEGQPALLYLWTYVSSVVANLFFFDRPWVALYGGVAMGLVAVPYAWALWVGRD